MLWTATFLQCGSGCSSLPLGWHYYCSIQPCYYFQLLLVEPYLPPFWSSQWSMVPSVMVRFVIQCASHSGSVTPLNVKSHKSISIDDLLISKIHYPLIGRTRWYVAWKFFWTSHAIMVVVLVTDLYAFNIGCYVFWATAAAVRYVVYYLRRHALGVLQRQILKWSAITAKSIVLLSLWVCLLHLLLSSYCFLCNHFFACRLEAH